MRAVTVVTVIIFSGGFAQNDIVCGFEILNCGLITGAYAVPRSAKYPQA